MASITKTPVVETVAENSHIVEIGFTLNKYNDITMLDFIHEHKISCKRFGTEWTVWTIFQKTLHNEPVQGLVSLSRTDDEDVKVQLNLNLSLCNTSTGESSNILDVSTTETEKGWEFKKSFEPLLKSENLALLNNGNLDVKLILTVFGCHESLMQMKQIV